MVAYLAWLRPTVGGGGVMRERGKRTNWRERWINDYVCIVSVTGAGSDRPARPADSVCCAKGTALVGMAWWLVWYPSIPYFFAFIFEMSSSSCESSPGKYIAQDEDGGLPASKNTPHCWGLTFASILAVLRSFSCRCLMWETKLLFCFDRCSQRGHWNWGSFPHSCRMWRFRLFFHP